MVSAFLALGVLLLTPHGAAPLTPQAPAPLPPPGPCDCSALHCVYVDPVRGNDRLAGTSAVAPFQSLERAQRALRRHAHRRAGAAPRGACAVLMAGRHARASPLLLDGRDSGVRWSAMAGASPPSISGGVPVAPGSWKLLDAVRGVWGAAVAPQRLSARQLYVNGRRANRTSFWFNQAARVEVVPSGLVVQDRGVGAWVGGGDEGAIELVWTGGCKAHAPHCAPGEHSYREARCPVASVAQLPGVPGVFNVSVARPCFDNARRSGCGVPSTVQNVLSLVTGLGPLNYSADSGRPGSFFHRAAVGQLLYIPLPGEDMATLAAMLPTAEALVRGGAGLRDVRFDGLVFEHATWLLPSTALGYVDDQSGTHVLGHSSTACDDWGGAACPLAPIPGNVHFENASGVAFQNCTFRHLGGTALHLGRGCQHCVVAGCSFVDVSASAVQIGTIDGDFAEPDPRKRTLNNTLQDSVIADLPVEFRGASAVAAFITRDTTIAHNSIRNAPYSGITLGWGWHTAQGNASYAAHQRVLGNVVDGAMQLLFDGGSLYTLGAQPGSVLARNHFLNQKGFLSAIYHDDGSAGWLDTENVLHSLGKPKRPGPGDCAASMAWVSAWTPYDHDLVVQGNYADHPNCTIMAALNSTVANTTRLPGADPRQWPAAAQQIAAQAGPRLGR